MGTRIDKEMREEEMGNMERERGKSNQLGKGEEEFQPLL